MTFDPLMDVIRVTWPVFITPIISF